MSLKLKMEAVLPIFVLLLAKVMTTSSAQCPTLSPVSNFNATAFAGRWYEIKRFKSVIDGLSGSCTSFNFTVHSENNITFGLSSLIKNRPMATQDRAIALSNGVFTWQFTIPSVIVNVKLELQYYIVDTDYSNYAVSFACGTIPIVNTNIQMAWIYGRNRTLDQVFIDKAISALKQRGQNTNNFVDTIQSGCTK